MPIIVANCTYTRKDNNLFELLDKFKSYLADRYPDYYIIRIDLQLNGIGEYITISAYLVKEEETDA